MSDPVIKSFKGGKSKAIRGLKSFGEAAVAAADRLLFQHGENAEWSFYVDDAQNAERDAKHAAQLKEPPTEEQLIADYENSGEFKLEQEQQEDEEHPQPDHTAAPNVFTAAAHVLSNVPQAAPVAPTAQKQQSRNSYTIEKNRPEQNGIKRPSAGGLCRAVWDAMDELRTTHHGSVPTSEQVRALAESKGWNKNNAMIEFYQWRKFNGIVGRTPKAAPVPAPALPAPFGPKAADYAEPVSDSDMHQVD